MTLRSGCRHGYLGVDPDERKIIEHRIEVMLRWKQRRNERPVEAQGEAFLGWMPPRARDRRPVGKKGRD